MIDDGGYVVVLEMAPPTNGTITYSLQGIWKRMLVA
jgi:hypothetical protein